MRKGDLVFVSAEVFTEYCDGPNVTLAYMASLGLEDVTNTHPVAKLDYAHGEKVLFRQKLAIPWVGAFIGWTWRITGAYSAAGHNQENEYDEACLQERRRFKVALVIPTHHDWWIEPATCLEADLTVIT